MSDVHEAGHDSRPKRGGTPTPRQKLAAAMPYRSRGIEAGPAAPPNFIRLPSKISFWGNYKNGDCVTAEEAFAKACNKPEIFVPEPEVIAWASAHHVLNGAELHQVMVLMQTDGFALHGHKYDDGSILSVDWTDAALLNQAISEGPVKIGGAADQLDATWHAAGGSQQGGKSGWFATGYTKDTAEDHCVSLCGYGTIEWLAGQLRGSVPSGVNGGAPGYALFTWDSIGIIDAPSLLNITEEAWLRNPTTVTH